MKRLNLAFLVDRPFSARDVSRYGVLEFTQDFNVYVLDLSSMISQRMTPIVAEGVQKPSDSYRSLQFADKHSLLFFLENTPISHYIDLLGVGEKCLKIRRQMDGFNAKRVKFFLGVLPEVDASKTIYFRLKTGFLKGGFLKRVLGYIARTVLFQFLEPKVDISVYSGSICEKRFRSSAERIIWAHSNDYQLFLDLSSEEHHFGKRKKYAVFLDQNAPSHPDYSFHRNKAPVTAENYYTSMNLFFDSFEEKTGLEVVIAAHPRTLSRGQLSPWGKRQAIVGKSPLLVRDSALVLAHYSTAISFAVLWRKPILQLTTREYVKSYRHNMFLSFSKALDLDVVNIDDYQMKEISTDNLFNFDETAYAKYTDLFLKSNYSDVNNLWPDVAEKISSNNTLY